MNNSYIGYLKNRFPIKFLSHIFRNYKKLSEQLQVETNTRPKVQTKGLTLESHVQYKANCQMNSKVNNKLQEFRNLPKHSTPTVCNQIGQHVNITLKPFKKNPEKPQKLCRLSRKTGRLDASIKEKIENIPIFGIGSRIPVTKCEKNRVYPWQNFNVDSVFKPNYKIFKQVNDVTKELINKKPPLKKVDVFKPVRKKEVKIDTSATLLAYPKINTSNCCCLNTPSRFNLSTNSANLMRRKPGDVKSPNPPRSATKCKVKRLSEPYNKNINVKNRMKYFPIEKHRFLCYYKTPKFFCKK